MMNLDLASESLLSQGPRKSHFPTSFLNIRSCVTRSHQCMWMNWAKWAFLSPSVLRWSSINCFMKCKWRYLMKKIYLGCFQERSQFGFTANAQKFLFFSFHCPLSQDDCLFGVFSGCFGNKNFWEVDWVIIFPQPFTPFQEENAVSTLFAIWGEYFLTLLILSLVIWLALVNRPWE